MTSSLITGGGALRASAPDPGAFPEDGTVVITGISYGTVVPGGGDGNASGVNIALSFDPAIVGLIDSVTVRLRGPDGGTFSDSVDAEDGLNNLFIELSANSISGEYEIIGVTVFFNDTAQATGLPAGVFQIGADEISSLIPSRFIDLVNPDEDRTPPELLSLDLPTRSIVIENDLPTILGGGASVEISFGANFQDDNSGLNIIEFEFDIGVGFSAALGFEIGLFSDLSPGERILSTLNTVAPAGNYIFELLRVSDDRGNTLLLTADDLAGLGFQNSVHVVTQADLQDATSPTVNSFSLAAQSVTIGGAGGSLVLDLNAVDTGFGATGVQTVTLVLISSLGSRYQLEANVVFGTGDDATATFQFPVDFPAGDFTVERISVNDAAFNRQDLTLPDTSLSVVNPFGGDIAANRLVGDDGDNTLVARDGDDTVIGGLGNDNISLGRGDDTSFAGPGDTGNDTIVGGSGNDLIGAAGGNDFIVGGQLITTDLQTSTFRSLEERLDGSDTLFGGSGDDTIYGGSPRFTVDSDGVETVQDFGSTAPDVIYAGLGNDFVQGSFGADELGGGTGSDTLNGGAGNDTIYGGRNDGDAVGVNDVISGENGNDIVFASGGNDSVSGGADNDTLFGGSGDDTLNGNGGQDEIFGGTGDDILSGGSGADIFFFRPGSGADTILDFDAGNDSLVLTQYSERFSSAAQILAGAIVTNIGGTTGLLLDFGQGDQLFLADITTTFGLDIVF